MAGWTACFAYGSNLDPDQMARRAPSARPHVRGHAPGWRLAFGARPGRAAGTATLRPDRLGCHVGPGVPGVVWTLREEDLRVLDAWEGVPAVYRRASIPVVLESGRRVSVWAYLLPGGPPAPPEAEYVNRVAAGYVYWKLDPRPLRAAVMTAWGRPEAWEVVR